MQTQKMQTTTETIAISEKRTELAAQRKAKQAEKKILKEAFRSLPENERKAIIEKRKKEKLERKAARVQSHQDRVAKMNPKKRQAFIERQKAREEFRALPKIQKDAIRKQKKATRLANKLDRQAKKQQKLADKLAKMSPKRRQTFEEKKKAREEFKALPLNERMSIKKEKKDEREVKKERFRYLSKNWSTEFPKDLQLLIIDGNNMRGGGPNRFSRNDILDFIEKHEWSPNTPQMFCWFDHNPSKYKVRDNIEVKFSNREIADDMIVKQVEENNDLSILVVTCDRGLALRVLDLGGKVMRNKSFYSR